MNTSQNATLAAFALLAPLSIGAARAQPESMPDPPIMGAKSGNASNSYDSYDESFAPKSLNINGEIGLPLNPTAQIPDEKQVRIQGSYYDIGKVKNIAPLLLGGSARVSVLPLGNSFDDNLASAKYFGLFAAGRTGNRLEISGGVARLDVKGGLIAGFYDPLGGGGVATRSISIPTTGSGRFMEVSYPKLNRTSFALGLKYLLVQAKSEDGVAVALGAGYNGALADNTHVYLVASKKFSKGARGIKAHLGLRYDRFKLQARLADTVFSDGVSQTSSIDTSETSSRASAFIGAEVPLSNTLSVVGELQSKNTKLASETNFVLNAGRTPYSLSLRYYKDSLNGSIGVQRQGILGKTGVFAQVGYGF